jgi:hypothetical protein
MEQEARLVLEHAIKKLDEGACPPEYVSWKTHVEETLKSNDEGALRIIDNIIDFVISVEQNDEVYLREILVGTNILTPSLTNRGWKFWKPLLLKRKYRKAVKSAVIHWSKLKTTQLKLLLDQQEKLLNKDEFDSHIIFKALGMDIASLCRQQLSSRLKVILSAALFD